MNNLPSRYVRDRQIRRTARLTAAVAAALLASQSTRAATLYWDSNGATPGAGVTPAGTWGTNAFWTTDPTGSTSTTAYAAGSDVVFSAGSDSSGPVSIALSGTQTANSVAIAQGDSTTPASYTFSGGGLSLGAGGLTIQSGSGATSIASVVTIAAAQSWANNSSSILTVSGAITYTNQLALTSGMISLAGSTSSGTGGLKLDGATLIVGNSNSFSAANTVTLNSGTIENINSTTRTVASTVNVTGDVTFAAIAGNAGVLTFSGAKTITGNRTLTFNDVTMNFSSKALTLNGDLVVQGTGGVTNSGGLSTGGVDRQITFNQAGSATFSGTLTDAASTITVAGSSNATFGALTGGTGHAFRITGSGLYTFNGASTFTGGATINNGVALLAIGGVAGTSGGLGSGAVSVNAGGELRVQSTNGLIGNSSINLAGGTLGAFQSSSVSYGGNIIVTADSTVSNERATVSATSVTNTFGTLSIGGQLLNLTSTNNQTGATSGITFGSTTISGDATFNVTNNSNGTNTTLLTPGTLSDDGAAHTITKSGNGTMTFGTAAGSLTAGTGLIITGGTVNETMSDALGSNPLALTLNSAAGTSIFTLTNLMTQSLASISLGGAAGTTNAIGTGSGTLTLNGDLTYDGANAPNTSTITGRLALSDGAHTFNIGSSSNSGAADVTISAVISDAATGGSITKTGLGALLLTGANTFTGGLTIKNGSVIAGVSNATTVSGAAGPSSAIMLGDTSGSNSASLLANTVAVSNPIDVVAGSTGTLTIGNNGGATAAIFNGGITLNRDLVIASTGTGSVAVQVVAITGTGNITINNAGTTSTVTISTGGGVNNIGTITNTGVSTGVPGNIGATNISAVIGSNVTSITQNSTSTSLQLSSATGNSFGDLFIKAGTLIGSGGANTVLGLGTVTIGDTGGTADASLLLGSSVATTANAITVAAGDAGAVYTLANSPITASTAKHSGAITLLHDLVIGTATQGAITVSGSISGTGNITINNVSGSALDVTLSGASINNSGTITNTGTNATNGGTIQGALGANVTSVIQNGPSKLTLSGNNSSFTGTVVVNSGTLLVSGASSLKSANVVSLGAAGTFDVNNALTVGGLNDASGAGGTVTNSSVTARVLTLGGNGAYSFGGALTSDNLGLTVALTGGSQRLSGNNTYTGATSVNLGTLILANDGTNGTMGGTAISVGSGATPTASAGHALLNVRGNYSMGTASAGSLTIKGGNTGATPFGQGTLSLQDSTINTLTLANATAGNANLTLGGAAGNAAIVSLEAGNSSTDLIAVGQTVALNAGGAIINIDQLSGTSLAGGTYNLITFGALTGAGQFAMGSTPVIPTGKFGKFSLTTTAGALQLVFSGLVDTSATAYWTGGLDSFWNSFSGGTSNFTSAAGGGSAVAPPGNNTDVFFTADSAANFASTTLGQDFTIDSLTFTGAGTSATGSVGIGGSNILTLLAAGGQGITVQAGSGNHTISAPVALGANQTWTVTDAATVLTVAGGVSGNFNLAKAGNGTLVLSGAASSYADTTISAGTLQVDNGGSLGTAIVTDNAALVFNRTDAALVVANSIGGTGTVTKSGTGTVALSGTNTYSGVTNVTAGVLNIRSSAALGQASAVTGQGVVVSAGAQIELQGGIVITGEALTITATSSGASITFGLDNVSGNNEWAGPVTFAANGANNVRIGSTSGTLTISGDIDGTAVPSGQSLVLTGAGNGILSGAISGSHGLISTSSGTWTLSGPNTFAGATAFQGGGTFVVSVINSVSTNPGLGTVHFASGGLGAPTTVSKGTINFGNNTGSTAGTLQYVGPGETTDRVLTLSAGTGTATVDQSGTGLLKFVGNVTNTNTTAVTKTLQLAGSSSGTGEIAGNILDGAGTTAVTKTGTGTWTLSGINTYTGATAVKAGTLIVSGSIAGSTTTVGDAANLAADAVLGGGGLTGDLTVGAAAGDTGAVLNPHAGSGNTAVGTTLNTGALTFFDGAAHLALELGRTQAFTPGGGTGADDGDVSDHVKTTGAVTLNGADLQLSLLTTTGFSFAEHDVLFLIINGSGSAVNGTFGSVNGIASTLTEGGLVYADGQAFTITYQASFATNAAIGGNDVALVVIPEPNAADSLLAGFGLLLGLRRRRLRHTL